MIRAWVCDLFPLLQTVGEYLLRSTEIVKLLP